MAFFWDNHITHDVPRGPFTESANWIRAHLTLVLNDQEKSIKSSDDKAEIKDAQHAKDMAERLLKLLPSIFPSNTNTPELSTLFHGDLSMRNILIDDDGKITGIIDWECVSALPLWRASKPPGFLQGKERNEDPKRD
jgi:Ser/Thr protein kinase RdoA (MazF antagonist)